MKEHLRPLRPYIFAAFTFLASGCGLRVQTVYGDSYTQCGHVDRDPAKAIPDGIVVKVTPIYPALSTGQEPVYRVIPLGEDPNQCPPKA